MGITSIARILQRLRECGVLLVPSYLLSTVSCSLITGNMLYSPLCPEKRGKRRENNLCFHCHSLRCVDFIWLQECRIIAILYSEANTQFCTRCADRGVVCVWCMQLPLQLQLCLSQETTHNIVSHSTTVAITTTTTTTTKAYDFTALYCEKYRVFTRNTHTKDEERILRFWSRSIYSSLDFLTLVCMFGDAHSSHYSFSLFSSCTSLLVHCSSLYSSSVSMCSHSTSHLVISVRFQCDWDTVVYYILSLDLKITHRCKVPNNNNNNNNNNNWENHTFLFLIKPVIDNSLNLLAQSSALSLFLSQLFYATTRTANCFYRFNKRPKRYYCSLTFQFENFYIIYVFIEIVCVAKCFNRFIISVLYTLKGLTRPSHPTDK
jgi:hypothetical protein